MWSYFFRRILAAVPVILGVLILTFFLFRVSAGDPAAAVLGKNPSPEELENMRAKLGTDKPLICGKTVPTELYQSMDFTKVHALPPQIQSRGIVRFQPDGAILEPGAVLVFPRRFHPGKECKITMEIETSGTPSSGEQFFPEPPDHIELANRSTVPMTLRTVRFFKPTKGWTDSQFFDTFREVISFQKEFPYVTFFQFGETLMTHEPIRQVLGRGMLASLSLMLPVFFGELTAGILLAMISALFRDRLPDRIITLLSVAGMSISYLALIIFCQWFFGYYCGWFPVWGCGTPRFLVLPVLAGILNGMGGGVRFYRTVFLNEMNREYLRTAAAKGCSTFVVCFKHLLRNAAIPIVTRCSTILPFLFTGSLLLESYFGIPGLGFKGVDALNNSDLQTLKALVILGAFLFIFINIITDIAYAWIDPRVRPNR